MSEKLGKTEITVIGSGLAGAEASWQLAQKGYSVNLFEMRPEKFSPAHKTKYAAELVCSNTFKSMDLNSAHGLFSGRNATKR